MRGIAMRLGLLAVLVCSFSIGCAAQQHATAPLPITVAPAVLTVTTTSLPGAQIGVAYTATLTASGGVLPYTWTVAGTLPVGLTLSTAGVLSGTPTGTPGTYNLTFTVTDSSAPVAQVKKVSVTTGSR